MTTGEAEPRQDSDTFTESDFVVVANRLPVDLERLPDGTTRWKRSPGGLVTALEPILRSNRGAWVGWAGVADAEIDPIVDGDMVLHPVPLSADEIADYYEASPTRPCGRSTTTSSCARNTGASGGTPTSR